jgi:hypothetical protein
MSIPIPFKTDFPLTALPFNSRVESQLNSEKNYYAVAFKPGFPLQAAELNEMQEIFYMQQTLTQTMFANWGIKQFTEQAGVEMTATPWNGCTPLSADLVTTNTGTTSISVTFNPGWYLVKDINFNGGFGVWVYISTSTTPLSGFGPTTSGLAGEYGIIVKSVVVNCTKNSPAGTNEDRTLQDSSNINVINGPCGAARMKLEVVGFGKSGSEQTGESFLPIITATSTGNVASVSFNNGYIIKQVSA